MNIYNFTLKLLHFKTFLEVYRDLLDFESTEKPQKNKFFEM